jgi:hypothetical protein
MKPLTICPALLLLFACSYPDNSGRIESLKVLESCTLGKCIEGDQQLTDMLDYTKDKSSPTGLNHRVNQLYNSMKQADSASVWLVSELNSLRSGIIRKPHSKVEHLNTPISLEYSSKVELDSDALPSKDRMDRIIEEIEIYRDEICKILIESQLVSSPKEPYYFRIKSVASFSSKEGKTRKLQEALSNSRICEDDMYGVLQIMEILTEKKSTWESMLSSNDNWIDLSMALLSIQQKILKARWMVFTYINMRIGCRAGYNFTRISPIVSGTTNAQPNDTIRFNVYLAAYNEYRDPLSEVQMVQGGTFIKTEKGKSVIEVVVPQSGEIEVKGKLVNTLKNGLKRYHPWSHKIKVVEPK